MDEVSQEKSEAQEAPEGSILSSGMHGMEIPWRTVRERAIIGRWGLWRGGTTLWSNAPFDLFLGRKSQTDASEPSDGQI